MRTIQYKRAAVALAVLVATGSALAQTMVEWVLPATPTHQKQTPAQVEFAQKNGRELPAPEILQPMLDKELPSYQPTKTRLTGTFKGGSSDVLTVLAQKWFEKFKTYHPDVTLSISPPYAGSLGTIELVKENLDFVFVSRELKPSDLVDFKAKFGYDPTSIPIMGGSYRHYGALDAMAFYVHKDNPIEKLSYSQIDAIYSATHLHGGKAATKWGDLGLTGEWADKPIKAWGIKPWNGFEEFIRQKILSKDGKRGEWRDDIGMEKVVFPMAKNVANDRYAVGYTGLAYLDAGVKVIPVGEHDQGPFIAPSYENVAMASYPLSRLVYFNVNKAPGKALPPVLDEFMRFVLSKEGQQVVLDHARYIPLRGFQAQSSLKILKP